MMWILLADSELRDSGWFLVQDAENTGILQLRGSKSIDEPTLKIQIFPMSDVKTG
jgi:hypothetical protein